MLMTEKDNLNWDVITEPLFAKAGQFTVPVPGKKAQLRNDTLEVIGVTGNSYEVFQNSSLKNLITPAVEEGILTIENIGVIKNGARVFIQASMNETYKVAGDETKGMITLLNSHDGTCALGCGTTAIRVICQNTFASALSELDTKIRHGKSIHADAENITGITKFIDEGMKKYTQAMEVLATHRLVGSELDDIIEQVYNKEVKSIRAYNQIVEFTRSGMGNEGKTLADVVNGFTQYTTHEMGTKDDARFVSSNFGRGAQLARKAMNVALAYAS